MATSYFRRVEIRESYSLKKLNTFGLDVSAQWFTEVRNELDLRELLNADRFRSTTKLVLGGGSNVLFAGDFNGLVISNKIEGIAHAEEDDKSVLLQVGAGTNWHRFVLFTLEKNYPGLENLSLIPGNVGAAPIQNIGAYGVEMKSVFHSLRAVELDTGEARIFQAKECRFGYRDSIFKQEAKGKYIITSVSFLLDKKAPLNTSYGAIQDQLKKMNVDRPGPREVSNAVIAIRQSKLPDPKVIGNAGSFFKNPEVSSEKFAELRARYPDIVGYPSKERVKLAAGWLIEQCGWKGKRSGNVGMHEKQALVLVNHGGATGAELIAHALRVQDSVVSQFGVLMEMEVNVV